MWYFAWILGVTAAAAIGVINVMWYEFQDEFEKAQAATRRREA
jgi:cyd operon protein YbgT